MKDNGSIDRLPPYSLESEQGVLGCCLLSPRECLPQCVERFRDEHGVFYDLRHENIFDAMSQMLDAQIPVDVLTLFQWVKDRHQLEQVGGFPYLSNLSTLTPSSANLPYYLEIVFEKCLLRRMIQTCTSAVGRIYDFEGDVPELIDAVERDILQVRRYSSSAKSAPIQQLVRQAMANMENISQLNGAITGLPTGFRDLDKITRGFKPGEMIVIAARPSMGKTSLAMNIAEHIAVEQDVPVGVFSLEMTSLSLVERMICCRARVNLTNVNTGFLTEQDRLRLTQSAGVIHRSPIFIDDTSPLSIMSLRAKARRMAYEHNIKVVVVDYLQLLHSTSRRADNRQQEISDISSGIKFLAKELGIPVIVLSQLNREFEREKSRKPRLSDLRESGAIEQDADVVGLLYRPQLDSEDDQPEDVVPTNLLIAKQRNGSANVDVHLTFLKSYTRFESASHISDADVPPDAQQQLSYRHPHANA